MTEPIIVVVDDERTFDVDLPVTYLRTEDEALAWFARWWLKHETTWHYEESPPAIGQLWLDHDLGDGQDVMVVVRFLRQLSATSRYGLPITHTLVHTQNPVGGQNIVDLCNTFMDGSVTRTGLPDLKGLS